MKSSDSFYQTQAAAADNWTMRYLARLSTILICTLLTLPCNAWQKISLNSSNQDIYVVIGSFSSLQAAQQQANVLSQQLGEPIKIAEHSVDQATRFRLVAGPYPPSNAAAKRSKARSHGVPDAWFLYAAPVMVDIPGTKFMADPPPSGSAASSPIAEIGTNQADIPVTTKPTNGFQEPPESEVSIRGYLKSYAIAQRGIDISDAPPGLVDDRSVYQSQNSLRLIIEGEPSDQLIWQLHYELTPVFYSSDINNPLYDTTFTSSDNSYRIADIEQTLGADSGKSPVYQNLDRFNLQWRLEPGDLTIGRQAIAFGSARVINPTDVFLPFNVQTLNQEYRIGIDAIRFQQPLGELGEVDMGMVLGKDAKQENSAAYVQVVNNFSGMDVHGILMRFADHNLVGMGVQTALAELGFWLEVAQVWNGAEYFRLSTGVDYAFGENVYGMIEYHYNGAGSRSSSQYQELFDDFAYQQGGVFLLGRNYLIPAINWTVSPLLTVSLQSISNLDDSSSFVNLSGEYSVSENLYSNFGIYYFYGDELKFTASPPYLELSSEYGINSDLLYLALRYYF